MVAASFGWQNSPIASRAGKGKKGRTHQRPDECREGVKVINSSSTVKEEKEEARPILLKHIGGTAPISTPTYKRFGRTAKRIRPSAYYEVIRSQGKKNESISRDRRLWALGGAMNFPVRGIRC